MAFVFTSALTDPFCNGLSQILAQVFKMVIKKKKNTLVKTPLTHETPFIVVVALCRSISGTPGVGLRVVCKGLPHSTYVIHS